MKKWLILAVIAAVFMVMFPACGNKDDGGLSEASDVKMARYNDGTADFLIVTWTGDSTGSRYDVAVADASGVGGSLFAPAASSGTDYEYFQGQNVYLFDLDGTVLGNEEPSSWSAKIAFSDIDATEVVLVGVVALSPGGYSFGSKVVWGVTEDDEKFIDLTPTP